MNIKIIKRLIVISITALLLTGSSAPVKEKTFCNPMDLNYRFLQTSIFSLVFIALMIPAHTTALVDNLKVEYSKIPIGIDVKNPRFSWQMTAKPNERGYMQTAYQVIVKNPDESVVWDSRKVPGSKSVNISYSGDPLKACTRYSWSVTIWDQTDKPASNSSWFETGLMNPDPGSSAWEGAQWIGGSPDDLVFRSHFLSVFKVKYTLRLDRQSKSTKASFILGANDSRLLDKNKNIFNIESKHDESYIRFELDISAVDGSGAGQAKLNIYRAGYRPDDDADKPLISVAIPQRIINVENKYESHTVYIDNVFGALTLFIDSRDANNRLSPPSSSEQMPGRRGGFNINPVGSGGDFIAFPLLADIGFSVDGGDMGTFSEVAVMTYREPSNVLFSENLNKPVYEGIFKTDGELGFHADSRGYFLDGGGQGTLITANPSRNSMPMLRTEFSASGKEIKAARLYVTARGIYEMYLNGKRVGEDWFNPGLTQYNITHLYQTYDVTYMIIPGSKNAMGAWLGEGWWSGHIYFTGSNWNFFGDRQSLRAKLVITYNDGSEMVVTTNDRDWKFYNDGPVLYGSFFQGELYDATKESAVNGWNTAGFDDSKWTSAVEIPLRGTTYAGTTTDFTAPKTSFTFDKMSLIGQIGENAGIVKELTAVKVDEVRPGIFVYDMGQNMVGVPRVTIPEAEPGKKITFRYSEVLYPDLPESGKNVGMIMIENLRAALVQDIYITKGGNDIFEPGFTFHGSRFIEIIGIEKPLPVESV